LDRIDICVNVEHIDQEQLLATTTPAAAAAEATNTLSTPDVTPDWDDTASIIRRVSAARQRQAQRFASHNYLNSDMTNAELKRHTHLQPLTKQVLDQGAKQLELSARAYMSSLRVARTIADLEGAEAIEPRHITQALRYRRQF
jgi:predicted ATPase with chaperone activity